MTQELSKFLVSSDIVDYHNPDISSLATKLSKGLTKDIDIAKKCFEFERDNIRHTGDYKDNITTLKASDVLKHKTGWCYAKSHLLASLLRANNIPTGFCYQRLSCSEYKTDIYCLHGLNAIYLKEFGWYKVDARGNKEGVNASFSPPTEKLAFKLEKYEFDIDTIFDKPLKEVITSLKNNICYDDMINNFPDYSN